jgi:hypothetical protein
LSIRRARGTPLAAPHATRRTLGPIAAPHATRRTLSLPSRA